MNPKGHEGHQDGGSFVSFVSLRVEPQGEAFVACLFRFRLGRVRYFHLGPSSPIRYFAQVKMRLLAVEIRAIQVYNN